MIIPIELRFKADKDSKSAFRTDKTIKSHDINTVEFHISIDGLELTDNHTAKILSIFHSSKSQANVDCEIVDGKIIYKPDTKLISRYEHVTSYVYVYHNNQSLDVCEFLYIVDLSKIDETSLEVKEVYDQSYAELLTEFETRLQDYKDSLPQASDLRAEVDVILNKFKVDSVAKLSQYDADAQQVIADNQTAFDLAESGRQNTYEQAEGIRNQASNQAVVDWEQGADALVGSKLIEMQTDASTLINGAIDDFNQRGDAEIADWRVENSGELTALETEIAKKANKQQEDWITPTLVNGVTAYTNSNVGYYKDDFGIVHLRGRLVSTVTNAKLFYLPLNYRPAQDMGFPVFDRGLKLNFIEVGKNGGYVLAYNIPTVYLSLDGISFRAEV